MSPGPALLTDITSAVRELRARALEHIFVVRNRCAHPEAAPEDPELETSWRAVMADPEHASYHYFGRAFLSASLMPASEARVADSWAAVDR